jgi:hypothetical protein
MNASSAAAALQGDGADARPALAGRRRLPIEEHLPMRGISDRYLHLDLIIIVYLSGRTGIHEKISDKYSVNRNNAK